MEAKTIGSFIAVLRRASGMTQKEFAERLNVSDKTVSRWERDEGAPDLTLIPVIAEIFGVTCDELLRGERKSPVNTPDPTESASEEIPAASAYTAKAEKQRSHLIRTALCRHRNRSLAVSAVAGVGFIVAMVCNTGFNRAYLGFFLSAIFYLAAVVFEAMFINGTLSTVTEDMAEPDELAVFRYRVYTDSRAVFVLTAVLLGACIPLLMTGDAYCGLTAETWLLWGSRFAVIAALVCAVILYFVENHMLAEDMIAYPPKTASLITHRRKWKRNLTLICIALLAVSALLNGILTGFGSAHTLADSIRFDDVESFIAFAEEDVRDTYTGHTTSVHYDGDIVTVPDEQIGETIYYDRDGNVITEEQALTHTVEDSAGNVVFSFVRRNETIASYSFGAESDGFLPIHVITTEQMRAARRQMQMTNAVFIVLYILEVLACFFAYFLLRTPKKSAHAA